jgi:hypothetical protein
LKKYKCGETDITKFFVHFTNYHKGSSYTDDLLIYNEKNNIELTKLINETINYYSVENIIDNDINMFVNNIKKYNNNIIEYFDKELFNPDVNNFKLIKATDKIPNDMFEVWTDGNCLIKLIE